MNRILSVKVVQEKEKKSSDLLKVERFYHHVSVIFLSIGYSTCHWCHVMEHESFENAQVAVLLNDLFICIKVDREERPDIDQIYMAALQAMGEQGGWPLTMFLNSNAEPFWGGTYFPLKAQYGRTDDEGGNGAG